MSGILLNSFIQFPAGGSDIVPDTVIFANLGQDVTNDEEQITGINTEITIQITVSSGTFLTNDALNIFVNDRTFVGAPTRILNLASSSVNFNVVNNDWITVVRVPGYDPQPESHVMSFDIINQTDNNFILNILSVDFGWNSIV